MTIFSTLNCWNLHGIRHPFAHRTTLTGLLLPCTRSIFEDGAEEERGFYCLSQAALAKLAHLLPSPLPALEPGVPEQPETKSQWQQLSLSFTLAHKGVLLAEKPGFLKQEAISNTSASTWNQNIFKRNNRARGREQPKGFVKKVKLTKKVNCKLIKTE